ncbi:hypothetical protein [Streptomyces sp. NPDC000410]|uniref:hypothetical protein n=1 Tax=Streptomyces sp. NPDC000410 TaxID=3154254 RepID=UPI00332A19D6
MIGIFLFIPAALGLFVTAFATGHEPASSAGHAAPNPQLETDDQPMREGMLMQQHSQSASPGMRRVSARIGRCVLTYVLLYAAAWVSMALVNPEGDPYGVHAQVALGVFVLIGVPTLLLAVIAGLAHRRMDAALFRVLLVLPMLFLGGWPLIMASTATPMILQLMAQLAFVFLMPAPLIPEKWKGTP